MQCRKTQWLLWRNRLVCSAVKREVGGSSPPRSLVIVFCFDFVCMLVQSWIQSKTSLSQDLFEFYYFSRLSVHESFCELL